MSIRTERVSAAIKQQISDTIARDIDTSGFGLLTVTDVFITPDLRLAKVYVSHYHSGKSDEEILAFFNDQTKRLRMAVGKSVRLKFTPELRFYIDQTLERVQRVEELLQQIHEQEKSR